MLLYEAINCNRAIRIGVHRLSRFAVRSFYEQHKDGLPDHTREGASVCTARRERGAERGGSAPKPLYFFFFKKFLPRLFTKSRKIQSKETQKPPQRNSIKLPIPMNREAPYNRTSPPKKAIGTHPRRLAANAFPFYSVRESAKGSYAPKIRARFPSAVIAVPFVFSVYHTERPFVKGGGKNFKSETKKG